MSQKKHNLEEARKKLASIQGPNISFKRSRKTAEEDLSTSPRSTEKSPNDILRSIIDSPYGRCSNVSARYKKESRIGQGTYGIVYKAIDTQTSQTVALKRCLPHHEASDGFPITTLREVQILRELSLVEPRHENIVQLKEVAVSSKQSGVFLVFEYLHFDLATLIDDHYAKTKKSPFTIAQVKCLARQLFSALAHLHGRCIVHRDLKLSNLLYDKENGLIKLADFGLARRMGPHPYIDDTPSPRDNDGNDNDEDEDDENVAKRRRRCSILPTTPPPQHLTPKVVSLWSRPPELCLGSEQYDIGIDQWGAACIVAEFILGTPLLKGSSDIDQFQKIMDLLGPPDGRTWPDLAKMPLVRDGTLDIRRRRKRGSSLMDVFGDKLSTLGIELFSSLLQYDSRSRLTAKEATESEWFRERPLPTVKAFMPSFDTKSFGKLK